MIEAINGYLKTVEVITDQSSAHAKLSNQETIHLLYIKENMEFRIN
jgi:hypothetical protein